MHTGRNVTYFSSDLEKKTQPHTKKENWKQTFVEIFHKIWTIWTKHI